MLHAGPLVTAHKLFSVLVFTRQLAHKLEWSSGLLIVFIFFEGGGGGWVNAGFKQSFLEAQFDNPFQAFI